MPSKPLRIAQVTNLNDSVPPKHRGGLEQMVHYLIEELVHMGHEVTLFGTADSKTSAKLVPIWPMAVSRDPLGHLMDEHVYSMWAVAEAYIQSDKFDVIHDHTGFVAGHFAGAIESPVVSTIHHPISYEFLDNYSKKHLKYFYEIEGKHFSFVHPVVVSKFQQNQLKKKSHVIANGLSIDKWAKYTSIPGKYFAFLGYISGNKGVAEAIKAIQQTSEKLIIAGPVLEHDEASRHYFTHQVEPFIDNKQIKYIGPLGFTKKQTFLSNAKATLMPVQWDEPFGMVAIESMASGTPVIAWNRGALPEIIIDGVSGFLVNSVEELAEKIGRIDELDRAACRKHVEDNFSARRMAEEYEKLYFKILK